MRRRSPNFYFTHRQLFYPKGDKGRRSLNFHLIRKQLFCPKGVEEEKDHLSSLSKGSLT
jgi:hypothetical protein